MPGAGRRRTELFTAVIRNLLGSSSFYSRSHSLAVQCETQVADAGSEVGERVEDMQEEAEAETGTLRSAGQGEVWKEKDKQTPV